MWLVLAERLCEWMGAGATGECLFGDREGKPMVVCAGDGRGDGRLGEREGRRCEEERLLKMGILMGIEIGMLAVFAVGRV